MKIVIYTDGGARGNPGPAGAGAVIFDEEKKVLGEVSEYLGEQTNNWAEYEAIVLALQKAKELSLEERETEMRMDSELIQRQLTGVYKVKDAGLREQYAKVQDLLASFPMISFTHVRREHNTEADRLANAAMDRATE